MSPMEKICTNPFFPCHLRSVSIAQHVKIFFNFSLLVISDRINLFIFPDIQPTNTLIKMTSFEQYKLFLSRAGFGISLSDFQNPPTIKDTLEIFFSSPAPQPLTVITQAEVLEYQQTMKQSGDKADKKEMRKSFKDKIQELNLLWMQEMITTSNPLAEKMSLFWHGHFATQVLNPYFDQQLINEIRKNALGNFGDLLKVVSKSPAMLQFLNNQQNRKQHPNENFAREVMELFTLGRGHYSENDIKEAARAFTGWGYDQNGEFVFRERQHDNGNKTFLFKTGNFNGDDILNILLEQKQTAIFITEKIVRFFVTDESIDSKNAEQLSIAFYNSKYDISVLLKKIFTEDWFYNSITVGEKIKSPVELLVNYQRIIPLQFNNERIPVLLQRALGQHLFYPPNVAGWPGGTNWIDSSSLMIRMSLPEALFGARELDLTAKEIDPEMNDGDKRNYMHEQQSEMLFKAKAVVADWTSFINFWQQYKEEELPNRMANYLLNIPLSDDAIKEVVAYADKESQEKYIKSLAILFMKLPEFQMT